MGLGKWIKDIREGIGIHETKFFECSNGYEVYRDYRWSFILFGFWALVAFVLIMLSIGGKRALDIWEKQVDSKCQTEVRIDE